MAQEEYQANLSKIKLDNAIDNALNGAKAKNIKAVKALLDMEKVKFENDNLSGLDAQLKALQEAEDSKFLFEKSESTKTPEFSGVKPGEGNAGTVANPERSLGEAIMARLTGNN